MFGLSKSQEARKPEQPGLLQRMRNSMAQKFGAIGLAFALTGCATGDAVKNFQNLPGHTAKLSDPTGQAAKPTIAEQLTRGADGHYAFTPSTTENNQRQFTIEAKAEQNSAQQGARYDAAGQLIYRFQRSGNQITVMLGESPEAAGLTATTIAAEIAELKPEKANQPVTPTAEQTDVVAAPNLDSGSDQDNRFTDLINSKWAWQQPTPGQTLGQFLQLSFGVDIRNTQIYYGQIVDRYGNALKSDRKLYADREWTFVREGAKEANKLVGLIGAEKRAEAAKKFVAPEAKAATPADQTAFIEVRQGEGPLAFIQRNVVAGSNSDQAQFWEFLSLAHQINNKKPLNDWRLDGLPLTHYLIRQSDGRRVDTAANFWYQNREGKTESYALDYSIVQKLKARQAKNEALRQHGHNGTAFAAARAGETGASFLNRLSQRDASYAYFKKLAVQVGIDPSVLLVNYQTAERLTAGAELVEGQKYAVRVTEAKITELETARQAKLTAAKTIKETASEPTVANDADAKTVKKLTTARAEILAQAPAEKAPAANESTKKIESTGTIVRIALNGTPAMIDQALVAPMRAADAAAKKAGIGINGKKGLVLSNPKTATYRDQAKTIEGMAKRHRVPFDAESPNTAAAALRAHGIMVADVGMSNHEKGAAIDLYPDHAYIRAIKPILIANGFMQPMPDKDAGHFEKGGELTASAAAAQDKFAAAEPPAIIVASAAFNRLDNATTGRAYQRARGKLRVLQNNQAPAAEIKAIESEVAYLDKKLETARLNRGEKSFVKTPAKVVALADHTQHRANAADLTAASQIIMAKSTAELAKNFGGIFARLQTVTAGGKLTAEEALMKLEATREQFIANNNEKYAAKADTLIQELRRAIDQAIRSQLENRQANTASADLKKAA
jgi:hypothetical protein